MNKIFSNSEEKYLKSVVLYADADDGHVFYEEEHTNKVPESELFRLFSIGGLIVVLDEEWLIPVAYKKTGSYGTVTCIHDSAETATPVNFNSKEQGE